MQTSKISSRALEILGRNFQEREMKNNLVHYKDEINNLLTAYEIKAELWEENNKEEFFKQRKAIIFTIFQHSFCFKFGPEAMLFLIMYYAIY